jgi:hypothetical protein
MLNVPVWVRSLGTWVGLLILAVGLFLSGRELLAMKARLEWFPLMAAFLLGVVAVFLAAVRFQIIVKALDNEIRFRDSVSVVVWGGLANILPLPGAFMVRVGFLARLVGVKRATVANLVGLAVWFFAAANVALILRDGSELVGLVMGLWTISVLSFLVAWVLAVFAGMSGIYTTLLFGFQLVMTGINVGRLVIIAWSVGFDLPGFVAALFALSGVAAASTGVFPSGLGVGETLASGIALYMGISAALGFAVSAINRFVGWVGLAAFIPFIRRIDRERAKVDQ